MPIISRGLTWSKFYPLDSTHTGIFMLIFIEVCQEIGLLSITYVIMLSLIKI